MKNVLNKLLASLGLISSEDDFLSDSRWQGKVKKATDFNKPRYVYADLTESEKPMTDHGKVIGYRISENLVIHSMVGVNCLKDEIDGFVRYFGGKLLKGEEVKVFRKNFSTINKMRKNIGDAELPSGLFWAKPYGEVIEATTVVKPYEDDERARIANIILKR